MPDQDRHLIGELKDHISQTLDAFYDKVGRRHHGNSGHVAPDYRPTADIAEQAGRFEVSLELPGLDPDEVDVEVTEGWLAVRGEKSAEKERNGQSYLLRERYYGRFERSVPLPRDLDTAKATADFKNGVLTIRNP